MVDAGGFKMHLICTGEGAPTVVLDNGLHFGSFNWNNVDREIARFTRVCMFDRAGVGWSEASPHRRGINQINKELHELLINAGEQKPFILAGHSFAGVYVQNYANKYADEVAGVVLIDSSHAEQFIRDPDSTPVPPRVMAQISKIAAPIGLFRLIMGANSGDSPETKRSAAMQTSTKQLYASADELLAIEENFGVVRQKPMRLGDKPLIVLTRNLKIQPGATERDVRATEIWKQMQKDLVGLSMNGKQIISEKAGHIIQQDEPELVVDAIRQVVEATRR